eukprot:6199024-Pleurochrysis_carterae.AAC.1
MTALCCVAGCRTPRVKAPLVPFNDRALCFEVMGLSCARRDTIRGSGRPADHRVPAPAVVGAGSLLGEWLRTQARRAAEQRRANCSHAHAHTLTHAFGRTDTCEDTDEHQIMHEHQRQSSH